MIKLIKIFLMLELLVPFTLLAHNLQDGFYTARPKGMGGAFSSIANDKNAVWYNPAGITRMRKARTRSKLHLVTVPNMQASWNENGASYISALSSSSSSKAVSDILSSSADDFSTQNIFANASAFPMVNFDSSRRGQTPMAIAAFTQARLSSSVDLGTVTDNVTTAETSALADAGFLFDIAWNNKANLFSVGLQVRGIQRYDYEDILSTDVLLSQDDLTERVSNYSNKTSAIAVDFGMIWTFQDIWLPTISFSVMNAPVACKENYLNPFSKSRQTVCGTVFQGDIKNDDSMALVDPTDIKLGISMTPRLTRTFAFRVALEAHHLNLEIGEQNWGLSDIPLIRKLHLGTELFFGNPMQTPKFSLTAGANQGYISYGVNFRLSHLEFAYANYSEDISTANAEEAQQDNRHMFEVSFLF